jgi:hypothetical protein
MSWISRRGTGRDPKGRLSVDFDGVVVKVVVGRRSEPNSAAVWVFGVGVGGWKIS